MKSGGVLLRVSRLILTSLDKRYTMLGIHLDCLKASHIYMHNAEKLYLEEVSRRGSREGEVRQRGSQQKNLCLLVASNTGPAEGLLSLKSCLPVLGIKSNFGILIAVICGLQSTADFISRGNQIGLNSSSFTASSIPLKQYQPDFLSVLITIKMSLKDKSGTVNIINGGIRFCQVILSAAVIGVYAYELNKYRVEFAYGGDDGGLKAKLVGSVALIQGMSH